MNLKKTFLLIFFLLFGAGLFLKPIAKAQISTDSAEASQAVTVHLFTSSTCPHCNKQKDFFNDYLQNHTEITVYNYEVENRDNALLMSQLGQVLNIETGGVPLTIIGKDHIIGFGSAQTTGQRIVELIDKHRVIKEEFSLIEFASQANLMPRRERLEPDYKSPSKPSSIANLKKQVVQPSPTTVRSSLDDKAGRTIQVPLLGIVEVQKLSLPVLTLILGFLDGFNPCAMWTLLFLITLLLGMKDRKKMWLLGSTFILASGFVYFLFMTAWLNFFLLVGYVIWMRLLIGGVALFAGGYYLYDFLTNKTGACKTELGGNKKRIFEKLKQITNKPSLWVALGGMVLLAFAVNVVELVCSAGLPAVYTQVLSLSDLATWQYYAYIFIYVLIFMLDDLLIFFMAMTTLRKVGIDTRFSRYSHLVGGILMLIIGLALWFKPELLTFG